MFPRLWSHRHLVFALVGRQIRLRYRQSAAGFVWAIVPPLATLGVATLVFHNVVGVETGDAPYVVSTFAALIPWTFFANALTLGVPSVVAGNIMVTRFPFPRAVMPLSAVFTFLLDLGIAGAGFVVLSYTAGDGLRMTAFWFPLLLLIEMALLSGVVLLASALNVFMRDVRLALPLAIQLWLFLTPVMYPLDQVPHELRQWYFANPMTGLIESFRRTLVGGAAPQADMLLPAVIGALAVLAIGGWYFSSTESRFADVI